MPQSNQKISSYKVTRLLVMLAYSYFAAHFVWAASKSFTPIAILASVGAGIGLWTFITGLKEEGYV